MKKILLLLVTITLTFSLTACFGNYKEGYTSLQKYIVNKDQSKFALYYKTISEPSECTNTDGEIFTLVESDGNRYQYYGQKSGNCKVEVMYDTGMGLSSIQSGFNADKFTISDILTVNWAFDVFVDQDADYTIDGEKFVEYFEKVGTKDIYIIDYGNSTDCSGNQYVHLFTNNNKEYDVLGAPSGNQCVSNYYVYHDYDTTDKKVGDMYTFEEAIEKGFISYTNINQSTLESEIFEVYLDTPFLAVSGTIYFKSESHEYTEYTPYQLTNNDISNVLSNLSSYRYQANTPEEEVEGPMGYLTLVDNLGNEKVYELLLDGIYIESEEAVKTYNENDYLYNLIQNLN